MPLFRALHCGGGGPCSSRRSRSSEFPTATNTAATASTPATPTTKYPTAPSRKLLAAARSANPPSARTISDATTMRRLREP
jgi:hypothetical protein